MGIEIEIEHHAGLILIGISAEISDAVRLCHGECTHVKREGGKAHALKQLPA